MDLMRNAFQQFQRNQCAICLEEKTAIKFQRSHTCKRCGVCVCSKCSTNKILLYYHFAKETSLDSLYPQRVCLFCYKDYEFCTNYIKNNQLKWNTNSKTYQQWKSYIQNTNYVDSKKHHRQSKNVDRDEIILYQDCLEKSKNNELFHNDFEAVKKDVEQGRTDANTFNYSMREFIGCIQSGQDNIEIRATIQRVLNATIIYNPQLGYCQGMNYVAAFLLCFCDEVGAFILLIHLFDHILPDRFFQGGSKGTALIGFLAEQHFLKQIIQQKFDPYHVESLIQFTDYYASQFLLTLMTQPFSASCLIITWSEMFKKNSFYPISQAFLYTLDKAQQLLTKQGEIVQGLVEIVCRLVTHEGLQGCLDIKTFFFTSFERKMFLEQFLATTSRQWVNNEKLILFRLQKITQFSAEEILPIQTEFKTFCVDAHSVLLLERKKSSPKDRGSLMQKYTNQVIYSSQDELEEHENLTESDDDMTLIEQEQLHVIKQLKYGIRKNSFISLMMAFHSNYFKAQGRTIMEFDSIRYEEIFDIFDDNQSGLLDFREFLTCFSVLSRGSFTEKLELFFTAFGSKQQKYLTSKEFTILIQIIMSSYMMFLEDGMNLQEECKEFLFKMQVKFDQLDDIGYAEVMSLTKETFILDLEDLRLDKKHERRGTCLALIQTIGEEITKTRKDSGVQNLVQGMIQGDVEK